MPTKELNRSRAEQFAYQQAAIRNGFPVHAANVRVLFSTVAGDYVTARREGHECKKLRKSSMLKLTGAIASFARFVGRAYGTLGVDQVDAAMLRGFAEEELSRIQPSSASRQLNFILGVLEYAHERTLIADVPKLNGVHIPTPDDTNGNGVTGSAVPTAEEVRLIIKNARIEAVPTGERRHDGRRIFKGINANDYTDLFTALCLTGMRIGEAVHLTWDDVDFENNVILIRPGMKNGIFWQPKTKHGVRRIAMVPELATIPKRLRRTNRRDLWVFETMRGTQVHAHNVEKRFRQICDQLRFEKHFVPHSLRKYWASTVAQQGMPWQVMIKMFGHGDFKLILETYYAQNDDARLVDEAGKIDFGLVLPDPIPAGIERLHVV
ncbi:MAG: site-specific integrase [Phycisphaerae bacterium]|nr:site-specific integrase [Phycisphaerae bacterium]